MPKTRLISPGSIPNHRLLKNLVLNGNAITNDLATGGTEGITITDDGDVKIEDNLTLSGSGSAGKINTGAGALTLDAYNGEFVLSKQNTNFIVLDCDDKTQIWKYDTNNVAQIEVAANGVTTLSNRDYGEGNSGHIILDADGEVHLDSVTGIINMLNAGATADELSFTNSGTNWVISNAGGDISIDCADGSYIYFKENNLPIAEISDNSGTELRLRESPNGADSFYITTTTSGATEIKTVDLGGSAAHLSIVADGHVEFEECGVGFKRKEATFSITAIIESAGSDDTDIDFRLCNKYRLEITDDINTMNLIFPDTSGNFLIVCDIGGGGGGDHDVTNWKVWEHDSAAGSTNAASTTDVMWAGGSVPAFTSGASVDIVSFYWDADEQQCYGVASLAFATP